MSSVHAVEDVQGTRDERRLSVSASCAGGDKSEAHLDVCFPDIKEELADPIFVFHVV